MKNISVAVISFSGDLSSGGGETDREDRDRTVPFGIGGICHVRGTS